MGGALADMYSHLPMTEPGIGAVAVAGPGERVFAEFSLILVTRNDVFLTSLKGRLVG